MKIEIFCSLQMEGIHSWNECPIEEVNFLRFDHRHIFFIRAYLTVSHSDRDIEFIQLKHQIQSYLRNKYWDEKMNIHNIGHRSCEMIAIELIKKFNLDKCEVSEDNENGSIVTNK